MVYHSMSLPKAVRPKLPNITNEISNVDTFEYEYFRWYQFIDSI